MIDLRTAAGELLYAVESYPYRAPETRPWDTVDAAAQQLRKLLNEDNESPEAAPRQREASGSGGDIVSVSTEPSTSLPSSQYMDFTQVHEDDAYDRKTKVFMVTSKSSGALLARVSWHGAWRQYVFIPAPKTLFNRGCLEDINALLAHLMAERCNRKESNS